MKSNQSRPFHAALALMLIVLTVSSCSASKNQDYNGGSADYGYYAPSTTSSETSDYKYSNTASAYDMASTDASKLRIVYVTRLRIETLNYQESHDAIMDALESCDGYIYSSNQSGGANANGVYTAVQADFSLRIPVDNKDEFLAMTEGFGKITSRNDSSEDITSTFVDTEKKIESLKVQEKRLLELVASAKNLDELLRVETELSNVRYQIESQTARLEVYRGQTEYATVNMNVYEVTVYQPVLKKGFFSRAWDAIMTSTVQFVTFMQNLCINLIYAFPYLVLLVIAYFILRPFSRRRRLARQAKTLETSSLVPPAEPEA